MKNDKLMAILKKGEGETIEFKESHNGCAKEIVAFANNNGGSIFIGINDDGAPIGIKVTNRLLSQIQDIANNCDPSVPIQIIVHENNILEIVVPQGTNRPYRCKEGFFIRTGASSQRLKRDEIANLILSLGNYNFDETINRNFTYPQDFDQKLYDQFIGLSSLPSNIEIKDLLISLKLASEAEERLQLTNAGALFFAKNNNRFFKEANLVCVRYQSTDKFSIIDRENINGNPFQLIDDGLNFFKKNVKVGYRIIGNAQREEVYDYPIVAVREALVNAVAHRDYFYDLSCIYFHIYSDRIEIENPGGLARGIKIEDLGKRSVRRNGLIADMLFRAKYMEGVGSGFIRITEELKRNLNPPYQVTTSNFFNIRFFPKVENEKLLNLTDRQRGLYEFICSKTSASTSDCVKFFNVSNDTILRDLKILTSLKLIGKSGRGKSIRYMHSN